MEQLYHMQLTKVTGMVVLGSWARHTYTGTPVQLEAAYKKVLQHNLAFGWWSVPSLIATPIWLVRNEMTRRKLHAIIAQHTTSAQQ